MTEEDTDDDLAAVAGELAETLRELRRDLDAEPPRRGPAGLPRPPSPREFLRFADEVAIPATIAILEANIKLLEALRRAIRLADRERELRDRSGKATDRASELSAETVDRFDDALSELQRAIEEGPLPDDETARDVLTEARSLREKLDERVRDATDRADEARDSGTTTEIDVTAGQEDDEPGDEESGDGDGEEPSEPAVDVDSELEYLKDKYSDDTTGDDGEAAGDDGEPASDGDDDDDSDALASS